MKEQNGAVEKKKGKTDERERGSQSSTKLKRSPPKWEQGEELHCSQNGKVCMDESILFERKKRSREGNLSSHSPFSLLGPNPLESQEKIDNGL